MKQSPQEDANAEAVQYDKMPEQLSEVQADPRVGIMIIIAPHHLRLCIPLDLPNEWRCCFAEIAAAGMCQKRVVPPATFCRVVRHVQHEERSHFGR